MLKPKYGEIIIVGTVYKNVFNWYVTEKELWIMDSSDDPIICDERNNIVILNENTAEQFFSNIKDYKLTTDKLKELFISNLNTDVEDALHNFTPSIYVNFDKKELYSAYPESLFFQEYVPTGWVGEYINLSSLVNLFDSENRYWVINNKSYF